MLRGFLGGRRQGRGGPGRDWGWDSRLRIASLSRPGSHTPQSLGSARRSLRSCCATWRGWSRAGIFYRAIAIGGDEWRGQSG